MALSKVEDFAKLLCNLQAQVKAIQHNLNTMHSSYVTRESRIVLDAATQIEGTTWAEEM